jgi:hypothetical protein
MKVWNKAKNEEKTKKEVKKGRKKNTCCTTNKD